MKPLKRTLDADIRSLALIKMLILSLAFFSCQKDEVQPSDESAEYTVTTIAGSNSANPQFNNLRAIATDAQGNLYVVDAGNFSIRKISSAGTITTLAGGEQGYEDGEGSAAQFFNPGAVTGGLDADVYVTDGNRVRKVTSSGKVTTLAGGLTPGLVDGNGSGALFNSLGAIAADQQGTVYVIDNVFYGDGPPMGSRIRKISPTHDVTTLYTHTGIFNGLALDSQGNIYTLEEGFLETYIQRITPEKVITKFATIPPSSVIDISSQDVIHIAGYTTDLDYDYEKIYRVTDEGKYIAIAGGKAGFADGDGNSAQFRSITGLSTDAHGNLYLVDQGNNSIRKIVKR